LAPVLTLEPITVARVGVYRIVVFLQKPIRASHPPAEKGVKLSQTPWAEAMEEWFPKSNSGLSFIRKMDD